MKKKTEASVFSFWKENKLTGFFQLTDKELIDKFNEWIPTKEKDWLEYYNITDCINAFLMDALNAIGNTENEFAEYRSMEMLLKPIRNAYLEKQTA